METTNTVQFEIKTEDELKSMTAEQRSKYYNSMKDRMHDLLYDMSSTVNRLNDDNRRKDLVDKFNKTLVGKWMYAEHGVGNNPSIAYLRSVVLSDRDEIEIDMIHYAPGYSKFPIQYTKRIYCLNEAENEFDELNERGHYMPSEDKVYTENREACKKLLEKYRETTMTRIRRSVEESAAAYDCMIKAIDIDDPEGLSKSIGDFVKSIPMR